VPIGRVRAVGRLVALLEDLTSNPLYAERAGAVARAIAGNGVEEAIGIVERLAAVV
jgi:hypothetical protein